MSYIQRVLDAANHVRFEWRILKSTVHGAHIDMAVLTPRRQFALLAGIGFVAGVLVTVVIKHVL